MHSKISSIVFAVVGFIISYNVYAVSARTGFGGVATNMLEPVFLLSDFVSAACLIIGGSFIFASIIKFVEHRRNPLMVPISTVIFLLLAGLLLIGMPFMWMLAKYVNK